MKRPLVLQCSAFGCPMGRSCDPLNCRRSTHLPSTQIDVPLLRRGGQARLVQATTAIRRVLPQIPNLKVAFGLPDIQRSGRLSNQTTSRKGPVLICRDDGGYAPCQCWADRALSSRQPSGDQVRQGPGAPLPEARIASASFRYGLSATITSIARRHLAINARMSSWLDFNPGDPPRSIRRTNSEAIGQLKWCEGEVTLLYRSGKPLNR
jgi:hypothetical protein